MRSERSHRKKNFENIFQNIQWVIKPWKLGNVARDNDWILTDK